MIIRSDQLAVFADQQRHVFLERMIGRLDGHYPGRIRDEYGVDTYDFVDAGMAKAKLYGIEFEGDIESFLEMLVEWGPEFDATKAWAAKILTNRRNSGPDKIVLLHEYERFGD